jgi:phosphoglycolate phosphatase
LPTRIVALIDIDGTLLSTQMTEEGEKRRYVDAIRDVVGKEPYVVPSRFAGMVDPQICKILLEELGLSDKMIGDFLPKVLTRMIEVYSKMRKKLVLNVGVSELLPILAASPKHVTGVLTGNLRAIAEEKLKRSGIREYFSELFCADDYYNRTSLVENAVKTCVKEHGLGARSDVIIVGDTPRDIEAANLSRTTSVGIASGVYSVTSLKEAGATHVYPTMKPTRELLAGLGVK